ncbi:hypothetical protein HOY80DRAFT_506543 [Tuber brumale]|nr:hypothetical protein HOY80DRAFT_506543 [Tuber brumale]
MASHAHTIGLIPVRLSQTPATAAWALPFGTYLLLLSTRAALARHSTKTYVGDHVAASQNEHGAMYKTELGKTEFGKTEMSRDADLQNFDSPFLAGRCLGNYLETVPMAMILAALAELNGGSRRLVNYALGVLFMGKVAQIEFGLMRKGTRGRGRVVGFFASQGFMAGMAGYCAYLVRDYWGP